MKLTRNILNLTALLVASMAAGHAQSRGSTALQGAWEIEGTPQNAPAGFGPFRSFAVFTAGGAAVEDNGVPGAGAGIGAWEFTGAGQFTVRWVKPLWNLQTAAYVGLLSIKTRIRMKSADENEAHSEVEFRDPSGNVIASWTDLGSGKRIKAE